MSHAAHEALQGYVPSAVLQDGCPECEARASRGLSGLLELDNHNVKRLWKMMLVRERRALGSPADEPISDCDATACTHLYRVAVLIARHGNTPDPWGEFFVTEGSGLLVKMPNGDACFYCDDEHPTVPHSYWRANQKEVKGVVGWHRGTRLTGVTSATKVLDFKPDNLMKYAARRNGMGIAELVAPLLMDLRDGREYGGELDWLMDHEDIWAALEEAGLTYEAYTEERSAIGRNIHRYAFQALAEGNPVPHLDKLTTEEHGWAQAVVAFWLDHDPDADLVEQILISNSLGVAGRTDFLGTLTSECDDEACPCHEVDGPGVVDAKTGGYLSAGAHAQVHGYRLLARNAGFGETTWAALLKLREDGTYQLVKAEGDEDSFLGAVATYRIAGAIDREAGKARKERADG